MAYATNRTQALLLAAAAGQALAHHAEGRGSWCSRGRAGRRLAGHRPPSRLRHQRWIPLLVHLQCQLARTQSRTHCRDGMGQVEEG